ncbi:uncharacterized protein J5F26_007451 [Ciconia maguari]
MWGHEAAAASANQDEETRGCSCLSQSACRDTRLQLPQPIRMRRHEAAAASANQHVGTRGCSCLSQSARPARSTHSLLQLRTTRCLGRSQPIRGGRGEAQPIGVPGGGRCLPPRLRPPRGTSPGARAGPRQQPGRAGAGLPGAVGGGPHPWRPPPGPAVARGRRLWVTLPGQGRAGHPQRSPWSGAVFSLRRRGSASGRAGPVPRAAENTKGSPCCPPAPLLDCPACDVPHARPLPRVLSAGCGGHPERCPLLSSRAQSLGFLSLFSPPPGSPLTAPIPDEAQGPKPGTVCGRGSPVLSRPAPATLGVPGGSSPPVSLRSPAPLAPSHLPVLPQEQLLVLLYSL